MNNANVLVCVTRQKTCAKLIQEGAALAGRHGGTVSVVHVAEKGKDFLGIPQEAEAIEFLYREAKAVDAELTVLRAEHVLDTLIEFVKEQDVQIVLTGVSPTKGGAGFAQTLRMRLPGVEVHTIVSREE